MPRPSRDFFYVSTTKVDDLWQQLSPWWRRWPGRISGFTVSVLGNGGGLSVPPEDVQRTLIRRMALVERSLHKSGEVGSIEHPKRYFAGRLAVHYGAFDMVNPPVAYLIGESNGVIVALGGSLHHVRGRHREDTPARENARHVLVEPQVAMAVRRFLTNEDHIVDSGSVQEQQWAIDVAETYWRWDPGLPKMSIDMLARQEAHVRPAPSQLSYRGDDAPKSILIGSPVFVARA